MSEGAPRATYGSGMFGISADRRVAVLVASLVAAVAMSGLLRAPAVASADVPVGIAVTDFAPVPESALATGDTVTAIFAEPVTSAHASVALVGREAVTVPVALGPDGRSAVVSLTAPLGPGRTYRLTLSGTTPAGGTLRRVVTYYGAVAAAPFRFGGVSSSVLAGRSGVIGQRGRFFRFTLEVERGLEDRLQDFAQGSLRALTDSARGWTAAGSYRLQRVADPAEAQVRVLLARPALVDRLCRQAGLNTAGLFSCWNGHFAAINAMRWKRGGNGFVSLDQYRTYLTNHEFGHGLGLHHDSCPRRGALAPIMQQQTSGQDACRANGWPFPRGSAR